MSKPVGYKVPPHSTAHIRGVVHRFKEFLGIRSEKVSIVKIIELLAAREAIGFESVESLGSSIEGETTLEYSPSGKSRPVIRLPEYVYDSACLGDGRARFTIAHELGHAILHGNSLRSLNRDTEKAGEHKHYEDSEWQAHTFASELLMDSRYIKKGDTIADVSERFGTSLEASRIRLEKLNRSR